MEGIHVPLEIHCWDEIVLIVSRRPVVTVDTDAYITSVHCCAVKLDEVVDVGVKRLHVSALKDICLPVDGIMHKLNVHVFLVCRMHVATQHTCINSSVLLAQVVVVAPCIVFIVAHQMIPVGARHQGI